MLRGKKGEGKEEERGGGGGGGDLNIVTQRRTSHIILDSHQ
jgi:hypothetical protein